MHGPSYLRLSPDPAGFSVLGAASISTHFSCDGDAAAASAMPRRRAALKVAPPSDAAATPGPGGGVAAVFTASSSPVSSASLKEALYPQRGGWPRG